MTKLRQIEVALAEGKTVLEACKETGIPEQRPSRWRKGYGGMGMGQATRLKELEKENPVCTRRSQAR